MSGGAHPDTLGELRATLDHARELFDRLADERADHAAQSGGDRAAEAERDDQLEVVERDREELTTRLVEAEHQLGRLMNLYVATFQLHATLDPAEVQATIAEIAVDLLGAERFVLLLRIENTEECEVALSKGLELDNTDLFQGNRYSGGDPLIDASLAEGILRLGPDEFSEVIAVVPLRVQEAIVGVLVVQKLFDHKAILRAEDRDLLDLLAAHAASALFAARVYSKTDRKLRTLESLVQLVRGT